MKKETNGTTDKDQGTAQVASQDFLSELRTLMARWPPRMKAVGGIRAGDAFEDAVDALEAMLSPFVHGDRPFGLEHQVSYHMRDAVTVACHLDELHQQKRCKKMGV